ncbi:MAG TPA: branched-chain amino acid ABC transporter permease [Clostridia bacterium]|nr:branched-chain amino acid ABC transporter permease [Clostridia bacterium]
MNYLKDKKAILIIILSYIIILTLNKLDIINSYLLQIIMLAGINIIMTVSLNIVNGFTGQFSIGQAGFMAIGGYASAVITTLLFNTSSWPVYAQTPIFILSLIFGGLVAGFVGLLIGLPTLRLKGDYLAIVTLAFGEVVRATIRLINYVGGPRGLAGIPRYTNLFWVFVFTLLAIYGARNFVNSSFGRACISIRENEVAAETMGINSTKYKVLSFTFAAFMAGVAGGLFGHLLMFLQPDTFSFLKSNDYLVFLYAGGAGSISGSILSAIVLTVVPEFLRFLANWRIVIYALLLVVLMIKKPEGFYGGKEFGFLKLKKRNVTREVSQDPAPIK